MYPNELSDRESELISRRRQVAGVEDNAPRIGVACSGGGIRSATVCLGVFQAFAKSGLLTRVDYVSTISGGGYFGSFLGGLYIPRGGVKPADPKVIPRVVSQNLANDQSAPVKWLRKHGRYIAPNGPADYANIAAIYIRNWISVHYVIGITFLTLFFLLLWVRAFAFTHCDAACSAHPWLAQIGSFMYVHWSPYLIIPILLFLLVSAPLGWSFWLTQYGTNRDGVEVDGDASGLRMIQIPFRNNKALWASLFVLVVCALTLLAQNEGVVAQLWKLTLQREPLLITEERLAASAILVIGVLAIAYWIGAELAITYRPRSLQGSTKLTLKRRHALARNLLSDWLGISLKVIAITAAIAVIDSFAQSLYDYFVTERGGVTGPVTISSIVAFLLAAVHQLAPYLQRAKGTQSRWSWWTIAAIGGLIAISLIVLVWDIAAYVLAFRGAHINWDNSVSHVTDIVEFYLVLGIVLTLLTAQTLSFLNLSSLQAFYSARLRRAYLGATNPKRTGYDCTEMSSTAKAVPRPTLDLSIRREVAGDDSSWVQYTPHDFGGPLHLIGVTVNHTTGKGSDIDLRDRKGFTMTLGPAGVSAAIDSHAILNKEPESLSPLPCPHGDDPVFGKPGTVVQPEPCSLSRWMAISGAAFSTGLGANTRTGISVLLGAANVRLGYWWASGAQADSTSSLIRSLFRTQAYLVEEFVGRFAGSEYRHWYLSDGGHSENTGAYELIRRQLPLIVLLDNGADRGYEFEDFGNLVRRVRIDFGAEITPVSNTEWEKLGINSKVASAAGLSSLRRKRPGDMGVALADSAIALFRVTHKAGAESLLILAKPTLVGDEPDDIINYAVTHEAFPQEPTSDQFFDEAQWESYRNLGQHIGMKLSRLHDWTRIHS